jgi:hypothetical protein
MALPNLKKDITILCYVMISCCTSANSPTNGRSGSYIYFYKKPEINILLERSTLTHEDNIKIGYDNVDWIRLGQSRFKLAGYCE